MSKLVWVNILCTHAGRNQSWEISPPCFLYNAKKATESEKSMNSDHDWFRISSTSFQDTSFKEHMFDILWIEQINKLDLIDPFLMIRGKETKKVFGSIFSLPQWVLVELHSVYLIYIQETLSLFLFLFLCLCALVRLVFGRLNIETLLKLSHSASNRNYWLSGGVMANGSHMGEETDVSDVITQV